jgi:hypothetical protein
MKKLNLLIMASILGSGISTANADSFTSPLYMNPPVIYVATPAAGCQGLQNCITSLTKAVKQAQDGNELQLMKGTHRLDSPQPFEENISQLVIDKDITITSYDPDSDLDCSTAPGSCPTIMIDDGIARGIEIQSDGITIASVNITQEKPPSSTYANGLIIQLSNNHNLYDNLDISDVYLKGNRRGIWVTGENTTIRGNVFENNISDGIFVSASQGKFTIQGNRFIGPSKNGIIFESQQYSPISSGDVTITGNMLKNVTHLFLWNIWVSKQNFINLDINYNTVVNANSSIIVFYCPAQDGFSKLRTIDIANNIFSQSKGNSVLIDYQYCQPGVNEPDPGQINVVNNLTYNNTPKPETKNDKTNNYGYIGEITSDLKPLKGYKIQEPKENNQDPLVLINTTDFKIEAASPALNAAPDDTNIGAWQGNYSPEPEPAPYLIKASPRCASTGDKINVLYKGDGNASSSDNQISQVFFDKYEAEFVKDKANKNANVDHVQVTVPKGPKNGDLVDITLVLDSTPEQKYTGLDVFTYSSKKGACK